ncbi:MAG: hypothetical protein ACOH2J_01220 [Allorhizobium sp.]
MLADITAEVFDAIGLERHKHGVNLGIVALPQGNPALLEDRTIALFTALQGRIEFHQVEARALVADDQCTGDQHGSTGDRQTQSGGKVGLQAMGHGIGKHRHAHAGRRQQHRPPFRQGLCRQKQGDDIKRGEGAVDIGECIEIEHGHGQHQAAGEHADFLSQWQSSFRVHQNQ